MSQCQKCQQNFEIIPQEKELLQRLQIPTPTLCQDCRRQEKMTWCNVRSIYKRKCTACNDNMISIYSPDKQLNVYCPKCFWGDTWQASDYAQTYDFSKSFNEQFAELLQKVPLLSLINTKSQNSEYCHCIFDGKDNYLAFIALYNPENLLYTHNTIRCNNSMEIIYCQDVKWSYELIDSQNCYECFYSRRLRNCNNMYFSEDCVGCKNCFGCKNLVHKSYCVYNKQYSQKEYEQILEQMELNKWSKIQKYKKEVAKFFSDQANQSLIAVNCELSSGSNIRDCKNCYYCFDVRESENIFNSVQGELCSNCVDCYGFGECHSCSNSAFVQNLNNVHFSASVFDCNDIWYSYACYNNSSDCFACVGIKKQKYCILNKQYTKEEYELLTPKIIEHMKSTGEWGQFLNPSFSPFGYQESTAQEDFPLNQETALSQAYTWNTYEKPYPLVDKTISNHDLPDSISDVSEDILDWAIKDEMDNLPFKIIKQELDFYKKYSIPIPRQRPENRFTKKMQKRSARKLWYRNCDKCQTKMLSTYSPSIHGIYYCPKCYEHEMYK